MRFVVQHFRTPAFQQEMWVKILPCAPQCAVVIQQPGCLPSKQRTRVQVPPTAPKISSFEILLHSSSSGLRHLIAIQETKVRFLPIAPSADRGIGSLASLLDHKTHLRAWSLRTRSLRVRLPLGAPQAFVEEWQTRSTQTRESVGSTPTRRTSCTWVLPKFL